MPVSKRIGTALVALVAISVLAGMATFVYADATRAIVGGSFATERYPFMASLQHEGQHQCGGVLIDVDWLTTAAHCVTSVQEGRAGNGTGGGGIRTDDPKSFKVRIGATDWKGTDGTLVDPDRFVVHPNFLWKDPAAGVSPPDIALVHLSKPLPEEYVVEIADLDKAGVGAMVRMLGWGQECVPKACGPLPRLLKELESRTTAATDCAKGGIDETLELCVAHFNGQGPSFGDSGGPALVRIAGRWQLVGVLAALIDAKRDDLPRIYTKIATVRDWIEQQMGRSVSHRPVTSQTFEWIDVDGTNSIIPLQVSAMCVDILDRSLAGIKQCGGPASRSQLWKRVTSSDGTVKILNEGSGRCLEVAEGKREGGAIVESGCREAPSQRWRFELGALVNVASDMCLEAREPSPGTGPATLFQWTCKGRLTYENPLAARLERLIGEMQKGLR